MTNDYSTRLRLIQEARQGYHTGSGLLATKQAKIQTTSYPPLKSNTNCGAWRETPWLNHRGWWLEQAGFAIGTPYTIAVYEKTLIFTAN